MDQQINKIEKLIYACFKEITDHTMQTEVLSPHIKEINNNLKSMSDLVEEIKNDPSPRHNIISDSYSKREIKSDDEKESLIKLAYALSRFDYGIINDILKSNYNQSAVFSYLSHKMKVKSNTLKNYRDMFDPYVRQEKSNRKGWYQRQLSPEFRVIKELWDIADYKEIKKEISKIINHSKKQ